VSDAPETIWARQCQYEPDWTQHKDLRSKVHTEYRRADLPATDAQAMANQKVKALVEAVIHERNLVCQDIDMQISASNAVESALAALEVKS
jgi:hypothetical protein